MRLSTTMRASLRRGFRGFFAAAQSSILSASWNQSEGNMRPLLILGLTLALTPATTIAAQPSSGLQAQAVTDISAAKKHKKPKAPKEEYLKAAPGTGPSGPQK